MNGVNSQSLYCFGSSACAGEARLNNTPAAATADPEMIWFRISYTPRNSPVTPPDDIGSGAQ